VGFNPAADSAVAHPLNSMGAVDSATAADFTAAGSTVAVAATAAVTGNPIRFASFLSERLAINVASRFLLSWNIPRTT
jgi:fructose-1-phosphate kinase PfkB-like protein